MRVETVKVINPNDTKHGAMIINKSDYDADQASEKPQYKLHKDNAVSDDDQPGNVAGNDGRNPDGTFSEPTPTDIRYANKDATEFANNHRNMGASASQVRDAAGMEDKPGGIIPEATDKVKEAEAALAGIASNDGPAAVKMTNVVEVQENTDAKDKSNDKSKGKNK